MTLITTFDKLSRDYVADVLNDMRLNPDYRPGCHVETWRECEEDDQFTGYGIIYSSRWDGYEHLYDVKMYLGGWLTSIRAHNLARKSFSRRQQREYLMCRVIEGDKK